MSLSFELAKTNKQIKAVYNHNMSAFFDSEEFEWSLAWLEEQVKDGWEVYSVSYEDEILAAFFLKKDGVKLLSKQTPIKINYQGNGFSHLIKEEIESIAKSKKIKEIFNYCAIDNFRMVALNESHGYKKTGGNFNNQKTVVEWSKKL